jgi:hypothetical protein
MGLKYYKHGLNLFEFSHQNPTPKTKDEREGGFPILVGLHLHLPTTTWLIIFS